MAVYLLDSDVIIDALYGKRDRRELLRTLVRERHELACCCINITEVFSGMQPEEEPRTLDLLAGLRYYEVTWEIARKASLGWSTPPAGPPVTAPALRPAPRGGTPPSPW